MAIIIKTPEQIEILKEGGQRLAQILEKVGQKVMPGVSAYELDQYAESLILELGDIPAFKKYKPDLHTEPFPSALCVSVNGEVVHGIPKQSKVLQEGDVVSLDLGLKHKELFTDHAITLPVGAITKEKQELLKVAKNALHIGIDQAQVGNRTGDIGFAIEQYVKKYNFGIVRELAGHGVGVQIHEDPYIPNYGKKGTGELLRAGMVVAIEPMVTLGSPKITVLRDGYTVVTMDGKAAAHFEHTILITAEGPEILTDLG